MDSLAGSVAQGAASPVSDLTFEVSGCVNSPMLGMDPLVVPDWPTFDGVPQIYVDQACKKKPINLRNRRNFAYCG